MIAVLGSLNMDFVVRVERLPLPGETVSGSDFSTIPGGKGANQAYAAARLGAQVRMIGAVGRDTIGQRLKGNLKEAGVDVSLVLDMDGQSSGVALISVDAAGQNSIVISSGANGTVPPPDAQAFRGAKLALFQLESPLKTVTASLHSAKREGALTVLDPAPAQALSRELLEAVDILTPNETEALAVLGKPAGAVELAQADEVARQLGSATVILKLGAQGCYAFREGAGRHYPGFAVDVVDSTAAGDTFNGALACALAEGQPFERAVRFANSAAAISVTRAGAQSSAPSREEVERFLRSAGQ